MRTFVVTLTLTEEMLGTVPKNKDVYARYIATKAPEGEAPDEVDTVPASEEPDRPGWTGFHLDDDGNPGIYDYVIRGFFKAAATACRRMEKDDAPLSQNLASHKTVIDTGVFVRPRFIPLVLPEGTTMGVNERPLRADTAKGPRVTVVRSDTVPAGTTCTFRVTVLNAKVTEETLREWLDFGAWQGLGQWRSGGNGTFDYDLERAGA